MSRPRIILLGASNLTLNLPTIVRESLRHQCGPCDFFIANGHGRSFGMTSRVLVRSLPGILQSGLFESLRAAPPPLRSLALITDIGNDIMYGCSPQQIADWVRDCVDAIAATDDAAPITITQLPLESVQRLSPRHFRIVRTLFFPTRRITLADVLARAVELRDRLEEFAQSRPQVKLISQPGSWFGVDPIHIRRSMHVAAYRSILDAWPAPDGKKSMDQPHAIRRWTLAAWRLSPAHRWIFGVEQIAAQPSRRLADSSTISLF